MPAFADDNLPLSGGGGPTLSGGMQFKAAGGGLPNRITTQDPFFIEANIDYGGCFFDPNGTYFWITRWAGGGGVPTQYNLATGLPTGLTAASGGMGAFVFDTSNWYLADYSNLRVVELNWSGGIVRTVTVAFNPQTVCRVPGTTNKVWAAQYPAGTLTEYNLATGLATGRTVGAGIAQCFATAGFIWGSDTVSIYKWNESTLALVDTFTPYSDTSSYPAHGYAGYITDFTVDGSGRPVILAGLHFNIDRFLAASGGGSPAALDKRLVYAQPHLNGSGMMTAAGPTVSFAPDGINMAHVTAARTLGNQAAVLVRNVFGTQRARWTKTFAGSTTLRRITVPGDLCNDRGATYDLRKTRLYYSINGGARVNFTSGDDLAVPIVGGDVLTFDVDIIEGNGQATNAPFIGGTNGEGPHVMYDTSGIPPSTPVVSNVIPTPGTAIAANTPLQFDVTEVTPGLAYVYVWVLFQNSIDRLLIFNGHTFQGSFAQGSTITPIANGYRFVVNKFPFWPTAITELFVEAVDIGGGGG